MRKPGAPCRARLAPQAALSRRKSAGVQGSSSFPVEKGRSQAKLAPGWDLRQAVQRREEQSLGAAGMVLTTWRASPARKSGRGLSYFSWPPLVKGLLTSFRDTLPGKRGSSRACGNGRARLAGPSSREQRLAHVSLWSRKNLSPFPGTRGGPPTSGPPQGASELAPSFTSGWVCISTRGCGDRDSPQG